jgi:hypothetical protein
MLFCKMVSSRWRLCAGLMLVALGVILRRAGMVCDVFECFMYSLSLLCFVSYKARNENIDNSFTDE